MTKQYLNMADVFEEVILKHVDEEAILEFQSGEECGNNWILQDRKHWMLTTFKQAEYAAHAINSHDSLVAENERMKTLIVRVALMLQQSGVTPENESLNPLKRWIYDAFCEVGDEANLGKALFAAIKKIQGGAE